MEQILDGVWHWTAKHPNIGVEVSSYLLEPEGILLDPMLPAEGIGWFADHGPPADILLTNRHHHRDAAALQREYGCRVHVGPEGAKALGGGELEITPFAFGQEVCGLRSYLVFEEWPDEGAFAIPRVDAVAIADSAIHYTPGELQFVPDHLMGDDPEHDKAGLRAGLAPLLELEPEHLLLAHGAPVIGDGTAVLRRFVEG